MTIFNRIMQGDHADLVDVDPTTQCWLWKGRTNRKAYGLVDRIDANGRSTSQAHRVFFEAATGFRVPAGLHVLHLCDARRCCNPAHLAVGTNHANEVDRAMKRRGTGRHAGSAAA